MRASALRLDPSSLETLRCVVGLLNQQLADLFDLQGQTRQAHWNITGEPGAQTPALRHLFVDLSRRLGPHVDAIASRVGALGGTALGTVRIAAATSRLPEMPTGAISGVSCLAALTAHYASAARSIREVIETVSRRGDAATAEVLTEASRELDRGLWYLESHFPAEARVH